ncbi:MAG: hypothetical protein IPG45_09205 [Deltaproteobacteria bacterium]|nr:hypothetical protein [Deltaproteobacteria bacterium]
MSLLGIFVLGEVARAEGPEASAPLQFGRVYAENKAAVIRVKARPDGPWATGVLVGAGGEVVFSAPRGPAGVPAGLSSEGQDLAGELLGYDRSLALGVARFPSLAGAVRPVQVAGASGLTKDRWVVTIRYNAKGLLEPFAGVVEAAGRGQGPAKIMVPGQPGSPILSKDGELLGLVQDVGERSTRALPLERFVPFLKAVVLGAH